MGQHKLHKNVAIVAAGNLDTDGAIVHDMSTALQSRFVHLRLEVSSSEWLKWANNNGIDHRITSYIGFQPDHLYTFKPDHDGDTYASPRTWHFVDKLMKKTVFGSLTQRLALSGAIGEGEAVQFLTYCEIFKDLPNVDDLVTHPERVKVPNEPDVLFAMCGHISAKMTKDNAEQLLKYVLRLPVEFQVVCLRQAIQRNKSLLQTPSMINWIQTQSDNLFD